MAVGNMEQQQQQEQQLQTTYRKLHKSVFRMGFLAIGALIGFMWNLPMPAPASGVVSIAPDHQQPHPHPLEGIYAPNTVLQDAVRLFEGQVHGVETISFAPDGSMMLMDKRGGAYWAVKNKAGEYELRPGAANVAAGRPLGHVFDKKGNLVYADSVEGLFMLKKGESTPTLLTSYISEDSPLTPGTNFTFADDVAVADDGVIYFTAAAEIQPVRNSEGVYDTLHACLLSFMKGDPDGRLLSYNPATKKTHALAIDLWFPNGIALAADGQSVVFAETAPMRLQRHWIKSPKEGTTETVVDGLPGFPDGVRVGSDGSYWVALVAPNNPLIKVFPYRFPRFVLAWLPQALWPPRKQWAGVVQVSPEGEVLRILMDPPAWKTHISSVSSVIEHEGRLYFGNLEGDYISYLDMSLIPPVGKSVPAQEPGGDAKSEL